MLVDPHQSTSWTTTLRVPLFTVMNVPRQCEPIAALSFPQAAATIDPGGYEWWQMLTPALQYQLATPLTEEPTNATRGAGVLGV